MTDFTLDDFEEITTEQAQMSLSDFEEVSLSDFEEIGVTATEVDEVSAWEEFKYGFERTTTDVENAALWLESRFPLGDIDVDGGPQGFYISPEEKYGAEFMAATPEERRGALAKKREVDIQTKYAPVIAQPETSGWTTLGDVSGMLSTPTTLALPVKTVKGAAAAGAALAGEHSALRQLAETGEVEPVAVAKEASIGAAGGAAFGVGAKFVGKGLSSLKKKSIVKSANNTVEAVQEATNEAVARGAKMDKLPSIVQAATGKTGEEIGQAIKTANRKIRIPSQKEALIMAEAKIAKKDPTSNSALNLLNDLTTNLSSRVRELSEPVFGKLRKFEFDTHVNVHNKLKEVDPFLLSLNKLNSNTQKVVNRALFNGDFDTVSKTLSKESPTALKHFRQVSDTLDDLHVQLKDVGYKDLGYLENYFPRYVKNYTGLLNQMGSKERSLVDKALKEKASSLGLAFTKELPEEIQADVINKVIRGFAPKIDKGGLSFSKARTITDVNDSLIKHYANPSESLHTYIRRAVYDIEKAKFFGKGATLNKAGKVDVMESIGAALQDDMGNMSARQQDKLAELLEARFGIGEKGPTKVIQDLRNVGYMTTIANPYSALTQIQDLGLSAYYNGLRNTIKSVFGKKHVHMEDFGLDDLIAEEFATTGATAKTLNKLFTVSGFRAVDKMGKSVVLNSALRKAQGLSKNAKGSKVLFDKYGKAFGNEFPSLVEDLKAGRITDNVKLYLWNELSNVQPVSLSEMPVSYLKAPNGRIFYSLKSFALKQVDMLRNDITKQVAKGNYREAARNLARYAVFVPTAGATMDEVKDFIMGKEFNPEEIPDNYIENWFKVFMASEYTRSQGATGQVTAMVGDTVAPPLGWIDSVGKDVYQLANEGDKVPDETLRQLPLVGKFWYNFFGGGLEKYEAKEFNRMYGNGEE